MAAKKQVSKKTPTKKAVAAKTTAKQGSASKKTAKAKKAAKAKKTAATKKTATETKALKKATGTRKAAASKKPQATKKTTTTKGTKAAKKTQATKKVGAKKSIPEPKQTPVEPSDASQKTAPAEKPDKAKKNPPAKKKTLRSAFIRKQERRLIELRDDLVDSMSGVTGEIRNGPVGSEASGSGMHQGDAGSDAYDRDFALSVLAKEQDALHEVEEALRRIELGTYGLCEMSGEPIAEERLEAIPFARLTVECQAKWEKEYGKQRFRPKTEVGFSHGNLGEEDSESVSLDEMDE